MSADETREEECARNRREHGDKPCRRCRDCCQYYRERESNAVLDASRREGLLRSATALVAGMLLKTHDTKPIHTLEGALNALIGEVAADRGRIADLEVAQIEGLSDKDLHRLCEMQGTTVEREAASARFAIKSGLREFELTAKVTKLEKQADDLYYSLRMAEDHGVEEDLFEADERGTGPEGSYPDLEKRWQEKTPDYQVGGRAKSDESKEGGA